MKENEIIAIEITKAMIEKLTTVGDVFRLRNENFILKKELNELKRRESAQNTEIERLRKMLFNLELKGQILEGWFWTISSPEEIF